MKSSDILLVISLVLISVDLCLAPGKTVNFGIFPGKWQSAGRHQDAEIFIVCVCVCVCVNNNNDNNNSWFLYSDFPDKLFKPLYICH